MVSHAAWMLWSALVIVHLTAAQKQTETRGKSGPWCGNKRHCLSTATCSANRQKCLCPHPLIGNGKLGCVAEDVGAIFVQADPHLKNLFDEFLPIETPCRHRILQYTTPSFDRVEVYADNDLYKGGKYYINRAEVRFFGTGTRLRKLYILIEAYAEGGVYKFKEWRRTETDVLWQKPNSEIAVLGDYEFNVTYNQVDNFAEINAVDGFGFSMKFRPAEQRTEFQSQIPGVVLSINGDFMEQVSISENELSSSRNGPGVRETAGDANVTIEDYVIFLSMKNVEQIESLDDTCDKVNSDFKTICKDETAQLQAVQACSPLYKDVAFRKCLADNNFSDSFQAQLYRLCQAGVCKNNPRDCNLVMETILERTPCPVPYGFGDCSTPSSL